MYARPHQNGPHMMQFAVRFCRFLALLGTITVPGLAAAAQPEPWQMNLQEPATPLMEQIVNFHDLLLIIITLI